jgi:hypothetical protein
MPVKKYVFSAARKAAFRKAQRKSPVLNIRKEKALSKGIKKLKRKGPSSSANWYNELDPNYMGN